MINDGLLIIDKPCNWTSNDVVQKVKHLLGARRVGHTGTLDPDATGVLVLCVNQATKWSERLKDMDKAYQAQIVLGRSTDTGDASGRTIKEADVDKLTEQQLEAALEGFRGRIEQQVPLYAAVKVQGKALYRWARENKPVTRPRRMVTIHSLALKSFSTARLNIDVVCSKGTYIRALAEDIGRALGYPAHLAALRRTAVGPFDLTKAIVLERLMEEVATGRFNPADRLLSWDPAWKQDKQMPRDKLFT